MTTTGGLLTLAVELSSISEDCEDAAPDEPAHDDGEVADGGAARRVAEGRNILGGAMTPHASCPKW